MNSLIRRFVAWGLASAVSVGALSAAEPEAESPKKLHEPVYRVTKQDTITKETKLAKVDKHPLDAALSVASKALEKSRGTIDDYTAIFVKRERIDGKLGDQQWMMTKIRNEKMEDKKVVQPFSVYMKFLRPAHVKGREVIYVKGKNEGKLIAHEGGWKGKFTPSVHLDPHGALAMSGQRYPITDMGIENLCLKLIERGRRDRERGTCEVTTKESTLNKRPVTRIQVLHPEQKPHLDFHIARIFVDNEYGLPVRYEAYDWPRKAGKEVGLDELIEEITYVQLKFNNELTDLDFDPGNEAYNMK